LKSTVLFVPGLRDYVANHWQTLLAAEIPDSRTVPPLERDKLSCAARVRALNAALAEIEGPVILAAHSAGVLMVAHWALGARRRKIKGALLATPADIETPLPMGYPTMDELVKGGWLPIPRERLPFRSIVVASNNDPLASLARTTALARDWGSELAAVGDVGHLNPAAGFGPWPRARLLLEELDRDLAGADSRQNA
jgi:predicted alpha/beta hydrolase family esterase